MAYKPHTLVTFGGTLAEEAADDEIWECTIRGFGGALADFSDASLPIVDNDLYLSEVHAPLSAWFSNAAHILSATAKLGFVKCNPIGADGRYADDVTHVFDYPSPIAGGSGPIVPSFLSLAYSWSTARNRPPAARGRIYPPNFTGTLATGATANAGTVSANLAAARALLDVLANQSSSEAGFIPCVVSKTGAIASKINSVRVGNVWDVQRRRKNAVPEQYTAGPWP